MPSESNPGSVVRRLPQAEFVAMMALIVALLAVSMDAMLPAFPAIAAELSPDAPNQVPLIILVFILAMGGGTLFTGPLSDAFGRKPVVIVGIAIYICGSLLAWIAPTLNTLLLARALQGLGAAAPRVVATAMIRDLYEGREMARITSFVMTVFMLVPALAPSMGQLIIVGFGWRALFPALALFGVLGGLWLQIRQPETLPPEARRRFTLPVLRTGLSEVLHQRVAVRYILVLALTFGTLFSLLTTIQPVYDQTYGRSAGFPLWFMGTAVISSLGTVINGMLVRRIGMRRLATMAFTGLFGLSALYAVVQMLGLISPALDFPVFFAWSVAVFFSNGLIIGNLNALALQPLGHIAGMAASVISAVSTIGSAALALPVALAFDGTPATLLWGTTIFSGLALALMLRGGMGRPA